MSIPFLLFALAIIVGTIVLQVYLSKMESKVPGLVLPVIFLLFVIALFMGMVDFSESTGVDSAGTVETLIGLIFNFLLFNIPTFILLAIYFGVRAKMKTDKQIEKMNIQDL
ncbi:MAG: hypothetical protein IKZ87_03425 [Actinomycetaceae bacterium]|nr:hypothetical protein [Actinomycetaceae bacterium]